MAFISLKAGMSDAVYQYMFNRLRREDLMASAIIAVLGFALAGGAMIVDTDKRVRDQALKASQSEQLDTASEEDGLED